jgi:isoleucyl-tRNA synthetase
MEEVCEGKDFSFPSQEEKIISFWSEIKAFETQLERTKDLPEYIFYDGPPFATGLPHYGHILAGTIKDIVTRYQTMTGHHVTRRFGWDCHGLPVENEIDKKLGIKRRDEVLKLGIDKYNEECRGIVTRYVEEWEKVVVRVGRWIDFKNDYKTMDLKFMESVWWVFGKLFEKGLVYQGFKVGFCCSVFLLSFEGFLLCFLVICSVYIEVLMLVLFDYKIYCGFFMWVLEILQMQLSFVYIVLVLRN